MKKTIEELLGQLEKNNSRTETIISENREIINEIKKRPAEEWDWISVKTASKMFGMSIPFLYKNIERGKFKKVKRFENKIYLSVDEIMKINDVKGA